VKPSQQVKIRLRSERSQDGAVELRLKMWNKNMNKKLLIGSVIISLVLLAVIFSSRNSLPDLLEESPKAEIKIEHNISYHSIIIWGNNSSLCIRIENQYTFTVHNITIKGSVDSIVVWDSLEPGRVKNWLYNFNSTLGEILDVYGYTLEGD